MSDEENRSLQMLGKALEMEKYGYGFYDQAVRKSQNALGAKIFTMLRDDEVIHAKRIKAIYTALKQDEGWSAEWKGFTVDHTDLSEMYDAVTRNQAEHMEVNSSDLEALEVGIELETRAIRFYEKHLAEAENPFEREFLAAMIEEEQRHLKALQDMLSFLNNPADWFRRPRPEGRE
ncbi:MAG: ferritin family protein [Acidobacteria bacterium]|nr:ferritin family protein [Acidobacteriota bacterium]